MPKIPNYRRIFRTDYEQEYQKLVETLSVSINNGFEVLYDALNKKLSLKENGLNSVKDVDVNVGSNGVPRQTTGFLIDNPNISKVIGLEVILAKNNDSTSIYPTSHPFISFSQDNKTIYINHISGLQANTSYTLRIVAYGE